MTKRSATKRKRTREPIRIQTQRESAGASSVKASSQQSDDGEVVLVEADKVELSGTDDDEESDLSARTPPQKRSRTSQEGVTIGLPAKKRRSDCEKADEFLQRYKERKLKGVKMTTLHETGTKLTDHAQRRHVTKARIPETTNVLGNSNKKNSRQFDNLIESDSDEELINSCLRRAQEVSSSSAEESGSSSDDSIAQADSLVTSRQNDSFKTPPGARRRVGTRSFIRKANRSCTKEERNSIIVLSDESDDDSPGEKDTASNAPAIDDEQPRASLKRLVRRADLSDSDNDAEGEVCIAATPPVLRSKSKKKKIMLSPEATPSPPSTKKRLLRGKLAVLSDEEPVPESIPINVERDPLVKDTTQGVPEPNKTPASANKSTEWFQERDIDTFSSSSADFQAPSSSGSAKQDMDVPVMAKQITRRSPKAPPVRRDILKSFTDDDDNFEDDEVPFVASGGNTPTQSPKQTARLPRPIVHMSERFQDLNEIPQAPVDDVVCIDEDEILPAPSGDCFSPGYDAIRNSSSPLDVDSDQLPLKAPSLSQDNTPPPFNLLVLCNTGESVREMKERLGEEEVIARVTEAQKEGRDIIGGDELGLTKSFNRSVFNRFSKVVVGDQLGREQRARVVTEQALRGEYKFNYRGRDQPKFQRKRKRKGTTAKPFRGNGRLSNLRKRR